MYDVNTLTLKGAELLAAATAADKLILDGCDATTTFVDATTAASVSNRPASPLSNTTDVSLIGYTASHIQARASFIAGTNTGGDANTLYLYGHKQSAPSDIYVIYVASSQESFHLPEVGDVANVYETLFDIIYAANADAVTTAGTSTYCSLAEFNILKGRVVTTHKEGDNSTGDNQVVRGIKQFTDYVMFSDEISTGRLSAGPTTFSGHIHAVDSEEDPGTPNYDIGQSTVPFKDLYVSTVTTTAISSYGNPISVSDQMSFGDVVTVSDSILPNTDAVIHPVYPAGSDLGSATKRFKTLYCCEIANSSNLSVKAAIRCDGNITPSEDGLGTALGSASIPWTYINGGGLRINDGKVGKATISGNVVTFRTTSEYTFDTNTNSGFARLNAMNLAEVVASGVVGEHGSVNIIVDNTPVISTSYNTTSTQLETTLAAPLTKTTGLLKVTNGLTGNEPFYNPISTTRTVVPGSIIMVWAHISGGSLGTLHCGERFQNTGSDDLFYFAQNSGGTISSSNVKIPSGTYATLSDVNATGSATWFFVQCLSLNS